MFADQRAVHTSTAVLDFLLSAGHLLVGSARGNDTWIHIDCRR
jgi:hypothetical protein